MRSVYKIYNYIFLSQTLIIEILTEMKIILQNITSTIRSFRIVECFILFFNIN